MATRESEAVDPETEAPRTRPLAVDESLWVQAERQHEAMGKTGEGFVDEVIERSGFLVLRGHRPEDALFEALDSMHSEMDAMRDSGRESLWWVVRSVASAFPLPRRNTTGRYVPWIMAMAEIVEENARVEAGLGSAYAAEDVPDDRLGPVGMARIEDAFRRRTAQIVADRSTVPDSPFGDALSEEVETGDYP